MNRNRDENARWHGRDWPVIQEQLHTIAVPFQTNLFPNTFSRYFVFVVQNILPKEAMSSCRPRLIKVRVETSLPLALSQLVRYSGSASLNLVSLVFII